MMKKVISIVIVIAVIGLVLGAVGGAGMKKSATTQPATQPAKPLTVEQLKVVIKKLRPLHKKLAKPVPGDWLYHHKEPGQTFAQYLRCKPTLPRGKRRVIYIQPLGTFTKAQRKIVRLTGQFLGSYYNLPVKVRKDLPLLLLPVRARRVHPVWKNEQLLTTYVLDKILLPRLPKDAAVYLGLTGSDLWPGRGWNFVFGQASLSRRVGVWSIYRFGEPDKDRTEFRLCLLRTLKTAAHETGHMFSMLHCTAWRCCMCGSNSLAEADRRPLALCPECMAKVCWATGADPAARYRKLAEFCNAQGLTKTAAFYEKCIKPLAPSGD